MLDINNAVVVGDTGTVLRTTDGGESWQQPFSRTDVPLYSVRYFDSQNVTAVGANGTTIRSTDGGASWNLISSNPAVKFKSHDYMNANTLWAAGDSIIVTAGNDSISIGRIFSSTDGGQSWIARYSEPAPSFNKITFVSENVGFAVGNRGLIFATTDQGLTWRPRRPHNSYTNYLSVRFVDDSVGFITGADGSVLRTSNGGTKWSWIATGTNNRLHDIYFCTTQKGWIVGEEGSILYTSNGGGDPIIIEPPPVPTPTPKVIKLLPNYPNPFNDWTTLAFALSEPANVTIVIYDILGHKVKQFIVGPCESGVYDNQPANKVAPVWDGRNENGQKVASGCYISRLTTQQGQSARKFLFIR